MTRSQAWMFQQTPKEPHKGKSAKKLFQIMRKSLPWGMSTKVHNTKNKPTRAPIKDNIRKKKMPLREQLKLSEVCVGEKKKAKTKTRETKNGKSITQRNNNDPFQYPFRNITYSTTIYSALKIFVKKIS